MNRYTYSLVLLASCACLPASAKVAPTEKASRPVSSKAQSQALLSAAPESPAMAAKPKPAFKPDSSLAVDRDLSRADIATAAMRQPVSLAPHAPVSIPQVRIKQVAAIPERPAPPVVTRSSITAAPAPVQVRNGTLTVGDSDSSIACAGQRLARVTAYWATEGDYYTRRCMSATGVHLHDGHCAVDPSIIPYGSVVNIPGVGKFLAVDTGSAVISRTAAREGGHTYEERHALVIDIFFEDRDAGERFTSAASKFAPISWWTPSSTDVVAKAARSLFADEDWLKIQSKQL